jgi:hypothetical protein
MSQGKELESSGGLVNYYLAEVKHPQRKEQPAYTAECEDIIDALGLTPDEANIFKEIWRTANERTHGKGKVGNNPLRAAQKMVHYSGRILRKAQQAALDTIQTLKAQEEKIPSIPKGTSSGEIRNKITQEVIASGLNWTLWNGTTDGKPTVNDDLEVEVEFRHGGTTIGRAQTFDWRVMDHASDITRYRAAKVHGTGWNQWAGGKCPVNPDTVVEVILRNGTHMEAARAHYRAWQHHDGASDIVKYRVVAG